ncbi:diguanylate cyclase [Thiocapsa imhoffii]|uniref:diguanylate cyclase n=1 Tax=Thiocapsa imhoffii TaxID=382777 RepID=UPI00190834F1
MALYALWLIAVTVAAPTSATPAAPLADCQAQSAPPVELTPAEQAFLRAHPVITLGTGDHWEPYVIVGEDGTVTGYDADVLERIAALTGLRVRLLPGDWRERQEQTLSRAIDGLSTGVVHPERAEHLRFSAPYIRLQKYLLVPKGNPLNLQSRDDLAGRAIALHHGNLFDEKVASGLSHARILRFDTVDEIIDAVTTGDADATFDNGSLLYRANRLGRPFLQFAFDLNEPLELVFAVRDDWPEAISIIDKGLAAMGEDERTRLQARWFLSPLKSPAGTDEILLSDQERSVLEGLGPIRLCIDPDWMPFDGLTADGRSQGIMAELLNLAMARLGHTTQLVRTASWSETIQLARDGHCDIVSAVAITPERAEYLDFTGSLLSEPMVVVVREGARFEGTLDAHTHQRFVMVAGHAGIDMLRRAHPALVIATVPDVVTAMRAVSLGHVFGYIDLLPTVAYAAREHGILNVKVAGDLPQRYELAIGVRKGLPLLHSSLSRAVAAVPAQEIRAVRDRWISVRYEQPPDLLRFWPWALALALAVLGVLVWNHHLQRLNAALRAANTRIEMLTITDGLTGLYNRRHFQERLPSEWQRAARAQRTLHLLLADIDHFKEYNDHYGHPAGDEVLRQIGALLIQLTRRAGDLAFRTGGEEFAVMFTEASVSDAERLRVAVEGLGIEHAGSVTAPVVTLSIGFLTACPADIRNGDPPLTDWDAIYTRADVLLYEAKARGRNQVVSAVWQAAAAEEGVVAPGCKSGPVASSNAWRHDRGSAAS